MTDGWTHPDGTVPLPDSDGRPHGNGHGAVALPEPARRRWQPLRAGLVDLFFYDREEFWFRDGHLLLRGNNGTGKSKVLALLLPFLLDGEVAPRRVEPDGDGSKRMEWNLLLGGRYDERIGYTWLELGRRDEDGRPRYLTIGCGLKAVAGRGAPARWFFHTDQRVGVDLWLVNPTGTAKTKDRLAEALGDRGHLVEGSAAWRRTVDEHVFDLGAQRYEALIELLIQLRQPQLSKRPNEQALSEALTGALAPPDQAIVAQVADAFRSLEAERTDVEALAEAQAAVADFDARYRRYAAVATRRRAAEVRQAQSAYEGTNRRLTAARDELERAAAAEAVAAERVREASDSLAGHRAAERALRESPAMRQAATLDEVRKAAETAEEAAAQAAQRAEDARAELARAQRALAEAEAGADDVRAGLDAALVAAEAAALPAGLSEAHTAALRHLDGEGTDAARRSSEQAIGRRQRDARHLLGLSAAVDAAEAEAARRRELRDQAATARDAAAERHAEQAAVVAARGVAFTEAVRRWSAGCTELDGIDADALTADVAGWVVTLDGPNPAATAADAAVRQALDALAGLAARLERDRRDAGEERAQRGAERERFDAGGVEAPPAPHWRDDLARAGRPGAPLWQLVDFHDTVDDADRAGLEAALEGAGLLDAWLTPDGRLLEPGTLDTVLIPDAPARRSLAEALRPAVDHADERAAAVGDRAVQTVLTAIGLGADAGTSWVAADGRWRLGVAHGRWTKPVARYVGHAAREAARRQRLAELDDALARLDEQLTGIEQALTEAARRRELVAGERAALPDDAALRDATSRLAAAADEVARLGGEVDRCDATLDEAAAERDAAAQERDATAADLRLPSERADLEALLAAVAEYRLALEGLWPAATAHAGALRQLDHAATEVDRWSQAVETAAGGAAEAATTATAARRRHTELHDAVGTDIAELERRLEAVAAELAAAEQRKDAAQAERQGHHDAAIGAAKEVELLGEQVGVAADRRVEAAAAFQRFATHGLLAAAAPGVEVPDPAGAWAPDPTARLARRIDQALADVEATDQVWERVQHQITQHFTALTEALSRHGHHAAADLTDDGLVVTITYEARADTPGALAAQLAEDLADRERLLSARERELLENHLVADVATHLQELISRADQQVADVNRELAERPTSTGMRLRLVWKPRADAPENFDQARKRLLRQTADAWSAEDREAVGAFLQVRIADVRAATEGGTWLEHLTEALDYRRWHAFAVERHQDGQWRAASGPASGGERALAVTLPLFAAASSYYATAGNPHAPRFVLLDEAFAGVDDDARAKCMGLLAEFDLDFVMTSEREWGCYVSLPGLGIAQLARRDGIDAVHVTRWEWDGRARSRVDVDLPPLREPSS